MKNKVVVILLILLGLTVYYIDENACNPKGSAAAKINWAGHGECK